MAGDEFERLKRALQLDREYRRTFETDFKGELGRTERLLLGLLEAYGGHRHTDYVQLLRRSAPAVSKAARSLERRGYVTRERHGREIRLTITEAGSEWLRRNPLGGGESFGRKES